MWMNTTSKDKRNSERLNLRGLRVTLDGEKKSLFGNVKDFSRDGLKLTCLSQKYQNQQKQYGIIISGYKKDFSIIVQPCWQVKNNNENYQEIGFKIIKSSQTWESFIHFSKSAEKRYRTWLKTGQTSFA